MFDLDACIWTPELWKGTELGPDGGAPFSRNSDGTLADRNGTKISLFDDVRDIFLELTTGAKWTDTKLCIASSCLEPAWARECLEKFSLDNGVPLADIFEESCVEIYSSPTGSKTHHFGEISKKLGGLDPKYMMFFDDRPGNCVAVARLGVSVVLTPQGVNRKLFARAVKQFPCPGFIVGGLEANIY